MDSNERWTYGKKMIKSKKGKKKEKKKDNRRGEREKIGEREKKSFFFSSLISKIYGNRIVGFHRSKRQVGPRIESYAWVPKSWSFVKLHEVGNFLT